MPINKLKYTIAVCFILTLSSVSMYAQNFMISSVGKLPKTSNIITIMPFSSTSNCINVYGGISVLSGFRNNGEFSINCILPQEFNKLGLKIYPNPVKDISNISLLNPSINLNIEKFTLSIYTSDGVLVLIKKLSGEALFKGLQIDLSNLTSGIYFIKLESFKYIDISKFIKLN